MASGNKTTLGEKLAARLLQRSARRPRMGFSPQFFLRLGLNDPWLPEEPVGRSESSDGMVYVSGQPFYDMLQRLAQARWRRDHRLARYGQGMAAMRLRPLSRMLGATGAVLRSFALPSVGAQDMVVPAREADLPRGGDVEIQAASDRQPTRTRQRASRDRGPAWLQGPWVGARVAPSSQRTLERVVYVDKAASPGGRPVVRELRGAAVRQAAEARQVARAVPMRDAGAGVHPFAPHEASRVRPLERVSGRFETAAPEVERVRAIVGRLGRSARAAALVDVIERTADLAPEVRVRALRRVIRRVGPASRLVEAEVEEALDDGAVRPLSVAGARLGGRADRRSRGLRPVLGSSPMVDALRLQASAEPNQAAVTAAVQAIQASRLTRSPVVRTARVRAPRAATTTRRLAAGASRAASPGADGPIEPPRSGLQGRSQAEQAADPGQLPARSDVGRAAAEASSSGFPDARGFAPASRRLGLVRASAHIVARADAGVEDALQAAAGRDPFAEAAPPRLALRRLAPVRDARQRFVAAMQLPLRTDDLSQGGAASMAPPVAGTAPVPRAGAGARFASTQRGSGPAPSVWADARRERDDGSAGRSLVPRPVLSRHTVGSAAHNQLVRATDARVEAASARLARTPAGTPASADTRARLALGAPTGRRVAGPTAPMERGASSTEAPLFLSQVQRAAGRGAAPVDDLATPASGLATSRRAREALTARRSGAAPRTRPSSAAIAPDGTFLSSRAFEATAAASAVAPGAASLPPALAAVVGRAGRAPSAANAPGRGAAARIGPANRSHEAARSGVEHAVARLAGGADDAATRSLVPTAVPALSRQRRDEAALAATARLGADGATRSAAAPGEPRLPVARAELTALDRLSDAPEAVRQRALRADAPSRVASGSALDGVLPRFQPAARPSSAEQATASVAADRGQVALAASVRRQRTPQAVRAALRSQASGVVLGSARERVEPVEVAVPSRFGSLGPTSYVASLLGRWSRDVQVQAGAAPGQVVLTAQRPSAAAAARGDDTPTVAPGTSPRGASPARRRDQRGKGNKPQYALVREAGARRTPLQWVDIRSLGIDPDVAAAVVNQGAPTSIARLGAQVRRSAAVGTADTVTLRASERIGGPAVAGASGNLRGVVGRTPWRARPSLPVSSAPTYARASDPVEAAATAGRRGWLTSPFGARDTDLSGRGVAPLDTRWATAALPSQAYTLPHSPGVPRQLFDGAADSERADRPQGRGLGRTLGTVEGGRVDTSLPVWAQRSQGEPRIRQAGDLVAALVAADSADEVVQVLARRSADLDMVASTLPQPVIQIIRQIQGESDAAAQARGESAGVRTSDGIRGRQPRGEAPRSSARVVRGFSALRAHRGAEAGSGIGGDRVMKLASRLQELITLAEIARRKDQARSEVRMAEDSAAARQEGQAAPTQASAEGDGEVDVEALGREVLEVVARELELRRERRVEDPDERSIWW